ncbi:MAG: carboxypeptidase regulatory-like domain-containing protein [Bryobacteraceae bacterium]
MKGAISNGSLCGVLALLAALCVWAQSTTRLSGTVADQSGAVILKAEVTLTNTLTNVSLTTTTNEVGFYVFPSLTPGPYRLGVEFPGFQRYEVSLTLGAGQSAVIDPVLVPGVTTTAVEVRDTTPLVTVDSATIGTRMERSRVEQLPINGRALGTLLATQPGYEGSRTFGAWVDTQDWLVDGITVNDRRWGGAPSMAMPLESVQEFSLEANAVNAKNPRPVMISVVTKSGTNALHGSLFETHRNNAIGLARSRTDYYAKAPPLIRNEFGGSVGGPMVLPKLYNGKNRTFWFVSSEAMVQRQSTTTSYRVPTEAMRKGDMSGLIDAQGRLSVIYDPWTTSPVPRDWSRQPFTYGGQLNRIDPARISPVAKYLFEIIPLPTHPQDNPMITANWWGPQRTLTDNWTVIGRIDHNISDRSRFYAKWNIFRTVTELPEYDGSMQLLNKVSGWERRDGKRKNLVVNYLRTITPTFFNETSFGLYRDFFLNSQGGGVTGVNWPDKLNLPNPLRTDRWPIFTNAGFAQYGVNDHKFNAQTYGLLNNDTTKIVGKHEIQFGYQHRYEQMNILPQQRFAQPTVNFGTASTALYDKASPPTNPMAVPFTGHNMANFFLGLANYTVSYSHGMYYLRTHEAALYLQDRYKITQRLTLNLGLRWEYWSPIMDKNNAVVGFNPKTKAILAGVDLPTLMKLGLTLPSIWREYEALGVKYETWDQAGYPRSLMYSRKKNFSPRLGFAYRALDGRKSFVVRGGYSLAYFAPSTYRWLDNTNYNTPLRATFTWNLNNPAQSPDGLGLYMMRSVPQYVAGVNTGGSTVLNLEKATGINRGAARVTFWDPRLPDSRSHSINLTLEKELVEATVVRAGYIGTFGRNLAYNYNLNEPTPDYIWYVTTGEPLPTGEYAAVARRPFENTVFGTIQQFKKDGWNNYNGVSFEVERRYNKGMAFQFSYVMGNALAAVATVPSANTYMPGAVPSAYKEYVRFLNYARETSPPKHRLRWNFLVDLPFGKGKWFGRNAGGVLNRVIGGWQLAGIGSAASNYWSLGTSNWNFTGEPIHIYGFKYPIQDCTSGTCYPAYLYWNGYIPSNKINSVDPVTGRPNGYMGIPADYKPAVTPLIPWGTTTLPPNAPPNTNIATFWDTNNVWIPLKNGTVQRVAYNPNLHPWRNQVKPGHFTWDQSASLSKNVPITERAVLRLSGEFFNVFNMPGRPTGVSGTTGVLSMRSSQKSPRTTQLSLRLTF